MAAVNFIAAVRERLILLLERHDPTREVFKLRNTSRRNDTGRRGLRVGSTATASEFHRGTLRVGDGEEGEYKPESLGDEDGHDDPERTIPFEQEYVLRVVHEGENETANAQYDLEVVKAWRAGGFRLNDPLTPNSGLPYVFGWATIRTVRPDHENVMGDTRAVSRIVIPVRMQLLQSEL